MLLMCRKTEMNISLGIALIFALGRILVTIRQGYQFAIHDAFFYMAVTTLIVGTALTYIDVPYHYMQLDVQNKVQMPSSNWVQYQLKGIRIYISAVAMLVATLLAVKFSFLFLFRRLFWHLDKIMIWWWCVLSFTISSATIVVSFYFIYCPHLDKKVSCK